MPRLSSPVEYTVHIESAESHRAGFTVRWTDAGTEPVDIVLPSWVPGSYKIRDSARFLSQFRATDPSDGHSLRLERIDKARWRVWPGGAPAVEVKYEGYGHDLITEAFDLTPEHLFLNAVLCLPYIEGRRDGPAEVVLHLPEGWNVFTELPEVSRHPFRLRAPDYDTLVDQPIDCGRPVELLVRPAGIPHRILFCGKGANYEPHRIEGDVSKIVEATLRLMGDSPLSRYTFFYHVTDRSDGGLEHADSTSIVLPRHAFRPGKPYRRFLWVTAHEYLHLYNVKRIHPEVLGRPDFTRENYTKLLWWMEGTTDYYSLLLLRRSGVVGLPHFYDLLSSEIHDYLLTPGRTVQSLEELSFATWVDLYQPHEETPNRSVSYYRKGLLTSLVLDLDIRARTENRSSLDAGLRLLWNEYGKPKRGVEEEGIRPVLERATSLDLADFFARHVSGHEEIDLAKALRKAGLLLQPKEREPKEQEDEPGWLGVRARDADGLPRLTHVLDGGPARRAGLSPGDEIVALDGERISFAEFEKAWERFPPGTTLEIDFFRRKLLQHAEVTTGRAPPERYTFTPVEGPTDLERRIFESWLETPWEGPKTPAPVAKG